MNTEEQQDTVQDEEQLAVDDAVSTAHDDIEAAINTLDDDEPSLTEAAQAPEEQAEPAPTETAAQATAPASGPGPKPPIDWTPELKEQWGVLPEAVRESIHSREVAVNQLFQETAEARRMAGEFQNLTQSFAPVFAAEGVSNPMQGLQGLLQVTSVLQQGNKLQKAERVAGMIKHYGIDIEALDNILAGDTEANSALAQETQNQQAVQQMLDQRLAPVDALLSQVNQSRQQQQQQVVQQHEQAITDFAKDPANIHFNAVREVMADFVDVAAAQGQPIGLQEAYRRACAARPDLAPPAVTEAKKRAASSIAARPGGVAAPNDGSVYDALSAAWDNMAS